MTTYSFLKIGYLANLIVTDDRETAKSCIEQGYTLLTLRCTEGVKFYDGRIWNCL